MSGADAEGGDRPDGGEEARKSWRVRSRTATLVVSAVVLGLLAVGAVAGAWWRSERAGVELRELRATVERLRAERARTRELAARLDSVEARYARLRRLMTGDLARSERDVRLPAAPRTVAPGDSTPEREDRWSWPLTREGFVTRSFGAGRPGGHPGVDIAVPTGSYVRASRAGVVESAGRDSVYGLYVRVRHDPSTTSLYGHASWLFVERGDSVERNDVLALSGSTGRSTAPHLHFAIVREGSAVDPLPVLSNAFEAGRGIGLRLADGEQEREDR